ncbi:MAG: aminotransferase class V-fold PLP-dependent enzyme, partial [Planctomycetes bacterium]|nr:aminotransferase class V-fold PLP-dependent enzyme [Planctomycetota bacterium]
MTGASVFRAAFERTPGLVHLNNAGLSPINLRAREVVKHWVSRYAAEGMFCNDDYLEAVAVARGALARFLDAGPGEIAFFQSTAGAISQVAFEIGLAAGDEVLTWDREYASNLYPWKAACDRTGAKLVLVPSGLDGSTPVERLLEALTSRTRAVGISWVQFETGAITELGPLVSEARRRGIWTVVDVIQGVGQLSFSFRGAGVDAVCGGSHKWMTAPVGVGYLCLRKERAMELAPRSVGAYTYGTCEDPADLACAPKRDALRFEAGSKQVLEIVALGASADLLMEAGMEAVSAEVRRLAQGLADSLRDLGYEVSAPNGERQRTGIVTFTPGARSPLETVDA